ncbi:MAG TPA: hypothetical protein VFJ18_13195, partial [Pararhizobium sp.]|nr:hypothetical protein [Pararhizobium sp.]
APVDGDIIVDEVDFDPQAYVFGVFYDERLISTIRIHHVTPDHPVSQTGKVFPREVQQFLDAGMVLVDPTRLASDTEAFKELPGMHLLTMRLAVVASEFFNADRCLSMVVPQHGPFYRRMIESRMVAAPTEGTGLYSQPLQMMASDFPNARERIYRRFPFFRAQPSEMRMLFGDLSEFPSAPLTILPTARYASNFGRMPEVPPQETAQPEASLQ